MVGRLVPLQKWLMLYKASMQTEAGVDGNPLPNSNLSMTPHWYALSSAWYPCGTIVEYAYESDTGPVVEIDGIKVCSNYGHHVCAGTIVMDKNHTISIGSH